MAGRDSMKHLLRAVLLVSLIANVILLALRSHGETPVASPHERGPPRRGPMPSFPLSGVAPTVRDYSSVPRETLERRLVAAEAQAADLTDITDKFANATRSLETEARVKPYLDEVFARYQVPEPKYRFECRGRVCKIDSDVEDEWTRPLQETWPTRRIFREMSFSPAGTFVELVPPDQIPQAFLDGMRVASLVRAQHACRLSEAPAGDLSITISYDATTRRVTRDVGGSLSGQPIGACVAGSLDEVIATTALPPEMAGSTRVGPVTISLPLSDDDVF
jgi:hypothetical protein